jgi:hypothetical protein
MGFQAYVASTHIREIHWSYPTMKFPQCRRGQVTTRPIEIAIHSRSWGQIPRRDQDAFQLANLVRNLR